MNTETESTIRRFSSPGPVHSRYITALLITAFVCVAAPLIVAAYQAFTGLAYFGPTAAVSWSLPWLAASLVGVLVCLGAAARLIQLSRRTVTYQKDGLELSGFSGLLFWKVRRIFWEEIRGIAARAVKASGSSPEPENLLWELNIFLHHGNTVRIRGRGGKNYKLGEILELTELVTRLKARLYPQLLPALQQTFRSGAPIQFGPIRISQAQLEIRRFGIFHPVPWQRVRRITVQSGFLVVEMDEQPASRPAQFPINQIPNLELLLQIVGCGVKTWVNS